MVQDDLVSLRMDMQALTKSYYTALERIAELIDENNNLKEKLNNADIHTS
jgi:hypothetical protein